MKINEVISPDYRNPIDGDELLSVALSPTYKWYFEAFPYKAAIFRGRRNNSKNFLLVNPAAVGRKSANTTNEYTLLMSNHPTWKQFPRRDSSIICTTSSRTAEQYGYTYAVVLPQTFKVGICPANDLWASFDLSSMGLRDLDRINDYLRSTVPSPKQDLTYQELADGINNYKFSVDSLPQSRREQVPPLQYIYQTANTTGKTPLDVVMDVLDPYTNHFGIATTISGLRAVEGYNYEVWTSDNCLLIDNEQYLTISKEVRNQ